MKEPGTFLLLLLHVFHVQTVLQPSLCQINVIVFIGTYAFKIKTTHCSRIFKAFCQHESKNSQKSPTLFSWKSSIIIEIRRISAYCSSDQVDKRRCSKSSKMEKPLCSFILHFCTHLCGHLLTPLVKSSSVFLPQ